MKLYRTVSLDELAKLMIGEVIEGRIQKSCYCVELVDGEERNMQQMHKDCVCAFFEPMFFSRDNKGNYVMLELEIPDSEITIGYGYYFTPLYNKYIDESICSEFGIIQNFINLIKTKIKEAHFESYDYKNVVKIMIPSYVKRNTKLGRIEGCQETFDYDEMQYHLFSRIRILAGREIRKDICSISLPEETSLKTTIHAIKNEIQKNSVYKKSDINISINVLMEMLNKFTFFIGEDIDIKIMKNKAMVEEQSFANDEILSVLGYLYGISREYYDLDIESLKAADENNEKFNKIWNDFLKEANNDIDFKDYYSENETTIKDLLYTLSVDAKLVA